jgi:hypothetical protein
MRLVIARVTEAFEAQHGTQRLVVEWRKAGADAGTDVDANVVATANTAAIGFADEHAAATITADDAESVRYEALCYEALCPPCRVGDEVLINTTAVDLGLGTGGVCFVIANLTAAERRSPANIYLDTRHLTARHSALDAESIGSLARDGGSRIENTRTQEPCQVPTTAVISGDPHVSGHIMKLRYTPLQRDVLSVEEPASPHHELMAQARSLKGAPVVCCELHSQVPLVAAAARHVRPQARIAYCMTDEAALLAPFSTLLAQMRQVALIDACISCGQAFGGDVEAANLYSALLAAVAVCEAEIIICAQGPGIVGTATPFGHGGLAQAQALNAAAALDGVPLASLRLSFADKRPRHQGVSHHTLATLGRACLAEAVIPLPGDLSPERAATIERQLEEAGILERHGLVKVPVRAAAIDLRGLEVTTMGRAQTDDPAFFSAAFAAGILAARLLDERVGV